MRGSAPSVPSDPFTPAIAAAAERLAPNGKRFKAIFDEFYMSARDMAVFAKDAGYDALIVKDVKDNYDGETFTGNATFSRHSSGKRENRIRARPRYGTRC